MKIRIECISKRYGSTNALNNISCSINDGEFVSFLGPSGSGKSTLLNIIAGVIEPTEGNLYFDDVCVNHLAPSQRKVGVVFQNYSLYPNLSVQKNIEFPLDAIHLKRKEKEPLVLSIAEKLRISSLLKKKPPELSGGEQQRVAIARALVKNPKVLLLDEPFSSLDARLASDTRIEVKKIQRELNITTILVTHNQIEAMELSDRIAIMYNGLVVQMDTTQKLYNAPATLFCASFLGDLPINTIKGTLDNGCFCSDDKSICFDYSLQKKSVTVVVAIRPEKLKLGSADVQFCAAVEAVSDHGREKVLFCKRGNNKLTMYIHSSDIVKIDHEVLIGFDICDLLVYDVKSNKGLHES